MIKLINTGTYLINGQEIIPDDADAHAKLKQLGAVTSMEEARKGTISWGILKDHNSGDEQNLRIKFDSLTSHDITYVGIIQTARASGMEKFPVPYVLTNCHNSLCAVGGTINQDDHVFALSAAKKYGGIYVPPHLAVIHSYNREMMAGCGDMILGSDSHTRYGALGTMGVGEGGGELAKQLVGRTYDMPAPPIVGVYLEGSPVPGAGPHDVALSLIKAVFENGFVKNKVMEFIGPGIDNLSVGFRNGIDVMTTETTCWSSIWKTDELVQDYLDMHRRPYAYKKLKPAAIAYYDSFITVDLSKIEPCIALPFHPSNVYTIKELNENPKDILAKTEEDGRKALDNPKLKFDLLGKYHDGGVWADQAIIAGCSGGIYENIMAVHDIFSKASSGFADYIPSFWDDTNFSMFIYPESQPVYYSLIESKHPAAGRLMRSGAVIREAFCGPCFGAGDTPANGELSIRHVTRNFPSREGSKPGEGQIASVALMDARSIAVTALNKGKVTPATEKEVNYKNYKLYFNPDIYSKRVYNMPYDPKPETELVFGPNIKDWPKMPALPENLLIKIASYITDPVTTTDELIPSGETSSYRSNPLKLAEFTLSRKDPEYVKRAKEAQDIEKKRGMCTAKNDGTGCKDGGAATCKLLEAVNKICAVSGFSETTFADFGIGSAIFARKPGDGSAREQAASCQRVLGASANLALEYATKRYRSNLINWGILPFLVTDEKAFQNGDYIFFPGIKKAVQEKTETIKGYVLGEKVNEITVTLGELTDAERQILIDGCLINYYARK